MDDKHFIDWTKEEDRQLNSLYEQKVDVNDIALILNRTVNAVRARYYYIRNKDVQKSSSRQKISEKSMLKSYMEDGCKYFSKCENCKFPVCVEDGYHPKLVITKKTKFAEKNWTIEQIEKYIALCKLGVDEIAIRNVLLKNEIDIQRLKIALLITILNTNQKQSIQENRDCNSCVNKEKCINEAIKDIPSSYLPTVTYCENYIKKI